MERMIKTETRRPIGRLDAEEHMIKVEVVTGLDEEGTLYPKEVYWTEKRQLSIGTIQSCKDITAPDSDIVLRRYQAQVLEQIVPLYHEFYRNEEAEGCWYIGLF